MIDLEKLQNGSDIRGIAMEGIADEEVNFTPEAAGAIAFAFARWLIEEHGIAKPVVCVGRDSRLSGEMIAQGIAQGLAQAGAVVYDFGLASTPAMFECTKAESLNADGAIMITASHLPFNRNGMKFFTKSGGTDKTDIKNLFKFVENFTSNIHVDISPIQKDFMANYSNMLVSHICEKTASLKPLKGLHIIVDAGNGVGGFFVDKVLITLGADTKGSIYLEPDGRFPNHIPNPEDKNVMRDFGKIVRKNKADLGIIFDTDVDRAALVDESGNPVSRNRLIALMSDIVLAENPNSTIVTDSVTSTSLKRYIENRGGVHHRFKRGYNNVIKEAIRLNEEGTDCPLAIETSGHGALRENHFLDDGAYMMIKVLIRYTQLRKEGKRISDVLHDYEDPAEAKEIRPRFLVEDFITYGAKLLDDFKIYVKSVDGWSLEEPNYEGVRVNCDKGSGDGWVLMRMSLHDPQLPINMESESDGGIEKIEAILTEFLNRYQLEL